MFWAAVFLINSLISSSVVEHMLCIQKVLASPSMSGKNYCLEPWRTVTNHCWQYWPRSVPVKPRLMGRIQHPGKAAWTWSHFWCLSPQKPPCSNFQGGVATQRHAARRLGSKKGHCGTKWKALFPAWMAFPGCSGLQFGDRWARWTRGLTRCQVTFCVPRLVGYALGT